MTTVEEVKKKLRELREKQRENDAKLLTDLMESRNRLITAAKTPEEKKLIQRIIAGIDEIEEMLRRGD